MSPDVPSIRALAPSFIISTGTQVVLKAPRPVSGGDELRPAGSVGMVVASPADNSLPYTVRFADGSEATALQHELALRRREIDDHLAGVAAAPIGELLGCVIYRCQVGSKAFGLATDESDDDLRGIYLPPARWQWSLVKPPEQLELAGDAGDQVYWELEKFLKLALKANPNVLETLWTPLVVNADETAHELRAIRHSFLSKHVYKTYSGYVLSQFAGWPTPTGKTGNSSRSTPCTWCGYCTPGSRPWKPERSAST